MFECFFIGFAAGYLTCVVVAGIVLRNYDVKEKQQ